MNIRLCRKKGNPTRKGKYIDKEIAVQLIEISRGVRAFREKKYAKAAQYLEKKAQNTKATDRIKFIVGASYTEIKVHEKEAADLLKSIIQKYKDDPKEKRPLVYSGAMLEYAKIQLRNDLTEFAIYLLEDITIQNGKENLYALTELAQAYDMQAQVLREKEKNAEALEAEEKAEKTCLKCKELSIGNPELIKVTLSARTLLGILYIRQGRISMAEQEFSAVKVICPESKIKSNLSDMNYIELFKHTYFKEESEEDVNKRIKRLEKKLEAIENGEEEQKKEYARELNAVSRIEYYEELSPELKISNGIDIFTGYKMYEYPSKGICVIDKIFSEIKDGKKSVGTTYIFPLNITFELTKLSRYEVLKMLSTENSIQKQEHKGDYYNLVQEKMKRAELEGLIIEEKGLKEKEEEIEKLTKRKEQLEKELNGKIPEENKKEGEQ